MGISSISFEQKIWRLININVFVLKNQCKADGYPGIIWLSNFSILSVPDEVYSRQTSFTLNLICTISLLSRGQYLCWWSQIEYTGDATAEPVNEYLRPLNRQLMPWNCQLQYNYLHSNVIMCIDMCIATLLTRWRKR